jgi:hypothetical protein
MTNNTAYTVPDDLATLKSPRLSWLRRVVLLDVPVRPGLCVVPGG